jgi:secreted PhoX family phosphatase
MLDGAVYFTATAGGRLRAGQIWRYTPALAGGNSPASGGTLELFYEVADTTVMLNPDNSAPTPGGNLLVCEDPEHVRHARLIIVTPKGDVRTLALGVVEGELTGPAFSPDGSTLFVNLQKVGITLAINGPWRKQ